jgi:hypothetical protein
MSEGMLGNLPLSEIRGPVDTLYTKLASSEGRKHLTALNKMLRGENPFPIVAHVQEVEGFDRMLMSKNLLDAGEVFARISFEASQIIKSKEYQEDTFVDETDLVLLHFNEGPEYAHVLAEMKRLGLERPSPKDALALGRYACTPEVREEIVFLHKPVRVIPDSAMARYDNKREPDGKHDEVLVMCGARLDAIDIQQVSVRVVFAARRMQRR